MIVEPSPRMLDGLCAGRVSWRTLIEEAADNAFDASASLFAITVAKGFVSFTDNGRGVTRDRLPAMVALGFHGHMETTALGRFGLGIKLQAMRAGKVLEVETISKDGKALLRVDWHALRRSPRWEIADPQWMSADAAPTGTIVTIKELRSRAPKPGEIGDLQERIRMVFHPALISGRSITFNGTRLTPMGEPQLSDVIESTLEFTEGRKARVRGGMLMQPSALSKVHVEFRHRVILPESLFACGEYSGVHAMFARVTLEGAWSLSVFKDDLPQDSERAELEEAVGALLQPILEKCHSSSMTADLEDLIDRINTQLPPEMRPARPAKKGKPRVIVDNTSNDQGRPAKEAKEAPDGPARKPKQRKKLMVEISDDSKTADHGVGYYKLGTTADRVYLSRDNPAIREIAGDRDKDKAARTLLLIAVAIYQHAKEVRQGELDLEGSFGARVWRIASGDLAKDAAEVA